MLPVGKPAIAGLSLSFFCPLESSAFRFFFGSKGRFMISDSCVRSGGTGHVGRDLGLRYGENTDESVVSDLHGYRGQRFRLIDVVLYTTFIGIA